MSDNQTAMVIEAVTHYKRKLQRHANDETGDVVLHCLAKLDRVPMTIEILQETGVGRIVNQLKKSTDPDSQIADEAKNIVRKWKDIVQSQEEEEERMNVDQQPEGSNRGANSEEDANTSSGPDDLEEANSIRKEDSGSDIGPPTLEPQIDSPPSKKHKSSKHSSSSKDRKRDSESSDKSRDKSHKSKRREDEEKHRNHKDDKSHSRSDKERKNGKDEKSKEHKSKSKSSKSSNELKHSRDGSKDNDHRKNGYTEKNGISKSSSSHHRDKSPRSSESNHTSSSAHNPKKKERSKEKEKHTSQKSSSEGMFESAMLGAGNSLTHKKASKKTSKELSDSSNSKINGESTNGNSLVTAVNVPKDINPNYKPIPDNFSDRNSQSPSLSNRHHVKLPTFDSEVYSGKKKTGMTRVYSGAGRKSGFTEVPKLFDLCILVLQENVDSIDECGGLSYDILEPILLRAKPLTLMNIEDHNEYLLEDTVQIWEKYCRKEFPKEERKIEECESWREMYERCSQEKADKFDRLTSKAKESYKKIKTDSRSTKLWDKRGGAKPPRDIKIRQERNGTAFNTPSNALSKRGRPSLMDPTRASSSASGDSSRVKAESAVSAPKKPKIAPLMAKTMKLAKGIRGGNFRR